MPHFLTHYYKAGARPFRSLCALPEAEAIAIMEALYDETCVILERFKEPQAYLRDRRLTEQWVRQQFIVKGGRPQAAYPQYMILGCSRWLDQFKEPGDRTVQIPLSAFSEVDVSFTYPDSMISYWFANDKPEAWYLPDYHGRVFTISEIVAIVEKHGMPEQSWETNLPPHLAPYIEAQVWNHELLRKYNAC